MYGALQRIQEHIEAEQGFTDRLGFMQDWDTGIVTPKPAPDGRRLDYEGWLQFIQEAELSDFLLCTRRSTFKVAKWPASSVAPTEYHLDFAKHFSTRLIPETLAIQYTDADNRLTASRVPPSLEQLRRRATDDIASKQRILLNHGPALRTFAPRIHEISYRVLVLSCFIGGEWLKGLRQTVAYFTQCKINWNGAASIALASIWTGGFLKIRQQKMIRGT
jgi:hypothetical protein